MKKNMQKTILKHGKEVLDSDIFRKGFEQRHHRVSTVGDHTLGVVTEALKICKRHNIKDEATLHNVVTACLCHDLGIIGRYDKFRNDYQCLKGHPKDSAKLYMNLLNEKNDRVLNSIRCHMFPMKICVPKYKEGWILILADKMAAYKERFGRPSLSKEDADRIMKLAGRNVAKVRSRGAEGRWKRR